MKIGFFITARLKSTRLKQKILLDINGKSILDRIIERCKVVQGIDGVVLCTSINPQDSILYDNALKYNIKFFVGSEEDVLDRLLSAARYFGFDAFLSITAENPLFSIYLAQLIQSMNRAEDFDFIFSSGLPWGCCPHLLNAKALEISNFIKKETDTEIWGPFVNRPDFFKICEMKVTNSPYKEEKRLTCDYPEDYKLLREVYKRLPNNELPRIHEVINLFVDQPDLWKINEGRPQLLHSDKAVAKFNKNFDSKKASGLNFAKSIGRELTPGLTTIEVKI